MKPAAVQRVTVVAALVVGAGVAVSAGLGGTASGGLQAKKATPFAPSRLQAVRLKIGVRAIPRVRTRGKTVIFRVRLSNVGDQSADLTRICETVPQGLTFVSGPQGFVLRGGSVCRTLATFPPSGTLIGIFRMRVSPSASAGVVVSTASARARGMSRAVVARASLRIVGPCPGGLSLARPLC